MVAGAEIADKVYRALADLICPVCDKKIEGNVYRCMDCTVPFHRLCLFIHCGRASRAKGGEAWMDAQKGIE